MTSRVQTNDRVGNMGFLSSFPSDGSLRPAAANRRIFIKLASYESPTGAAVIDYGIGAVPPTNIVPAFVRLNLPAHIQLSSVLLFADAEIAVTVSPGNGTFYVPPGAWFPIPAKGIHDLELFSAYPYSWAIIFSTLDIPVIPAVPGMVQEVWSNDTLTKTAIAGTADAFVARNFAARYRATELTPTDTALSAVLLNTRGLGQKVLTCYNAGGTNNPSVNVRVRQYYHPTSAEGITIPPEPATNPFTVANGAIAIVENNITAPFLEVQARVDAAAAALDTARLRMYFCGHIGAFR